MKQTYTFVFSLIVFYSLNTYAQIQVEDSGGITVRKDVGKPTTLYLVGDSPSDKIPIFSILSESQSIGATVGTVSTGGGVGTYSGTSSSYGQHVQRLCETPCKLKLEPGVYSLRIGDNLTVAKKLDLTVSGGELAYKVYPGSMASFMIGTLSFAFGIALFIPFGAIDLAFDSFMFGPTGDLILLGTGGLLTIVGIVFWVGPAFGSADPIPPETAKVHFAR